MRIPVVTGTVAMPNQSPVIQRRLNSVAAFAFAPPTRLALRRAVAAIRAHVALSVARKLQGHFRQNFILAELIDGGKN